MPDILKERTDALYKAVGECLMAWAVVEYHLQNAFAMALLVPGILSREIWSAPRAFEVRLNLLNVTVENGNHSLRVKREWRLLYKYIISTVKLRNQIAHATPTILQEKEDIKLEPYMVVTKPKAMIDTKEINRRTALFRELGEALAVFGNSLRPPPKPFRSIRLPRSHLLGRLRIQDVQNRRRKRGKP